MPESSVQKSYKSNRKGYQDFIISKADLLNEQTQAFLLEKWDKTLKEKLIKGKKTQLKDRLHPLSIIQIYLLAINNPDNIKVAALKNKISVRGLEAAFLNLNTEDFIKLMDDNDCLKEVILNDKQNIIIYNLIKSEKLDLFVENFIKFFPFNDENKKLYNKIGKQYEYMSPDVQNKFLAARNPELQNLTSSSAKQRQYRVHDKLAKQDIHDTADIISQSKHFEIRKAQLEAAITKQNLQTQFLKETIETENGFNHSLFIGEDGTLVAMLSKTNQDNKNPFDLGKGAYGSVTVGVNCDTGQQVAIKSIIKVNQQSIEEARHERDILAKMGRLVSYVEKTDSENNITEIYLVDKLGFGHRYIDRIYKEPMNQNSIGNVFLQAIGFLEQIQMVHDAGLQYLDVKLENMLWDPVTQTATVYDFGTAQEAGAKNNDIVGTLFYMAPEIKERAYSQKADIFSCGISLLKLFGQLSFPNEPEKIEAIVKEYESILLDKNKSPQDLSNYVKSSMPNIYELDGSGNYKIKPTRDRTKSAIIKMLDQMISADPNERGELRDHINNLKIMYSPYQERSLQLNQVGNKPYPYVKSYNENPKIVNIFLDASKEFNTSKPYIDLVFPPATLFNLLRHVALNMSLEELNTAYNNTKHHWDLFSNENVEFANIILISMLNKAGSTNNKSDHEKLRNFLDIALTSSQSSFLLEQMRVRLVNEIKRLNLPMDLKESESDLIEQYNKNVEDFIHKLSALEQVKEHEALQNKNEIFPSLHRGIKTLLSSDNSKYLNKANIELLEKIKNKIQPQLQRPRALSTGFANTQRVRQQSLADKPQATQPTTKHKTTPRKA